MMMMMMMIVKKMMMMKMIMIKKIVTIRKKMMRTVTCWERVVMSTGLIFLSADSFSSRSLICFRYS